MAGTTPYQEGNPGSKICFLAEAPANTEIKMGRPLMGASGMLWNELLRESGIARDSCYILNVFEERVGRSRDERLTLDKDGNILFIAGKGFTELGRERAKGALRRLSQCGANCIVPMGNIALSLVYGDTRIGKWRGSILSANNPQLIGRKFVATFHPAFLIRGNYPHRYTVIHDLKRALEESRSSKIQLPRRHLYIDPSFSEVVEFLREGRSFSRIATDIEILNWHISCFSVATSPSESMCIPILNKGGGDRWNEEQEREIWCLYAALMGDPKVEKVNQNILFDITVLLQMNNIFTHGAVQCTMCAQHILYPDFPKGLDFICSIHTREPYYKDDGKLWSKPWIDMDRFWRYSSLDSATALEAWENELEPQLRAEGYMETYRRTVANFPSLEYMMIHGMKLNKERLDEQKTEAKALLAQREADLLAIAEWDFNPGSPKQCQEYFYGTKGLKPYTSVKTGTVTTDDRAMARIAKRYKLPEARLVQEIRGLRKLISSSLEVRYDEDGRVRCSYNPRGATTGRLSSSETIRDTGMNMQNLDPVFKDFLEADL